MLGLVGMLAAFITLFILLIVTIHLKDFFIKFKVPGLLVHFVLAYLGMYLKNKNCLKLNGSI